MSVNINYHYYYYYSRVGALRIERANKYDIESDRCSSARENDLQEMVVLRSPPPPARGRLGYRTTRPVNRATDTIVVQ